MGGRTGGGDPAPGPFQYCGKTVQEACNQYMVDNFGQFFNGGSIGGALCFGAISGNAQNFSVHWSMEDPPVNHCTEKTGQSSVRNFTIGWTREPITETSTQATTHFVGGLTIPQAGSSTCDAGCTATVGANTTAWAALEPSPTGLYRNSADFVITYTGAQCNAGANDPNNPAAPPPPCTGYQGSINGKVACVAPAGAPPDPAGTPPSPPKQGNPAAGSDGGSTMGDPARNPPNGDGGNAGGPARAGDGSTPGSGGASGGSSGGGSGGGTGAPGGGSPDKGTDGKNEDGGDCERNPSAAGCGGTAATVDGLYTKKPRTVQQALSDFSTGMRATPIGNSITNFFTINTGSASCPTWTLNIEYFQTSTVIDFLCSSAMQALLLAWRLVLLVVASWAAFRIALY